MSFSNHKLWSLNFFSLGRLYIILAGIWVLFFHLMCWTFPSASQEKSEQWLDWVGPPALNRRGIWHLCIYNRLLLQIFHWWYRAPKGKPPLERSKICSWIGPAQPHTAKQEKVPKMITNKDQLLSILHISYSALIFKPCNNLLRGVVVFSFHRQGNWAAELWNHLARFHSPYRVDSGIYVLFS